MGKRKNKVQLKSKNKLQLLPKHNPVLSNYVLRSGINHENHRHSFHELSDLIKKTSLIASLRLSYRLPPLVEEIRKMRSILPINELLWLLRRPDKLSERLGYVPKNSLPALLSDLLAISLCGNYII